MKVEHHATSHVGGGEAIGFSLRKPLSQNELACLHWAAPQMKRVKYRNIFKVNLFQFASDWYDLRAHVGT